MLVWREPLLFFRSGLFLVWAKDRFEFGWFVASASKDKGPCISFLMACLSVTTDGCVTLSEPFRTLLIFYYLFFYYLFYVSSPPLARM